MWQRSEEVAKRRATCEASSKAGKAVGNLGSMHRQLTGPGTLVASPLTKRERLAGASVWANRRTCVAKEGSVGSEVLILRECRGAHEPRDNDSIAPTAKEGRLAGVDV